MCSDSINILKLQKETLPSTAPKTPAEKTETAVQASPAEQAEPPKTAGKSDYIDCLSFSMINFFCACGYLLPTT